MPPEPLITMVHDPQDAFENAQALREAAQGNPQALFVPITPGAVNVRGVGNDVLKAIGKNSDLLGAGRSGRDTWLRALLWLEVSEVQDIYVSRAHLLTGRLLDELAQAAMRTGQRLWLIVQAAALARHQRWFLERWPAQLMDIEAFGRLLAERPQRPERTKTSPDADMQKPRLPQVPLDDFTSFRASARHTLSSGDFDAVDAQFKAAMVGTRDYLARGGAASESAICAHVREQIADSDWMPEVLTRVRGSQVAAFHAGYLVKVNLDVLAATRTVRLRFEEEVARILSAYGTPRYSALAALAIITGRELADLAAIDLVDVIENGALVRVGDREYELPPAAAAMVDALVRERLSFFAADTDPLFVYAPGIGVRHEAMVRWTGRGMYGALKGMERESGLLLTAHLRDAGQRKAVAWAKRSGISVQKI